MKAKALAVVAMMVVCSLAAWAPAQQAQDTGGGRSGRSGRGNWDPAQMRQDFLNRLKDDLGAKDDEWQVISPKLDKVMTLSFQSRMSGMRSMFSRRDRGGDTNSNSNRSSPFGDSAVSKAMDDLRSALSDKSISADEISKRLANLRTARDAAKQELAKAQGELKELLNQRQEATLVANGLLD